MTKQFIFIFDAAESKRSNRWFEITTGKTVAGNGCEETTAWGRERQMNYCNWKWLSGKCKIIKKWQDKERRSNGGKREINGKRLNEINGMDWAFNSNGRKRTAQNRKCEDRTSKRTVERRHLMKNNYGSYRGMTAHGRGLQDRQNLCQGTESGVQV